VGRVLVVAVEARCRLRSLRCNPFPAFMMLLVYFSLSQVFSSFVRSGMLADEQ
jgi:hypothetical protein